MDKSSENKQYSGLLIYRSQRNVEYLLLNDSFTNKKHWFFPEGEVKGNEDDIQCVLREAFDLTGLKSKDLHIDPFTIQYKYLVGTTVKVVRIHVAQLVESHMRLAPNADGIHFMWCSQTLAVEKITTRGIDQVFHTAQDRIDQKIKTSLLNRRPRAPPPTRPDQPRVEGLVTHQRASPQPPRRQTAQTNDNPLYKTRLCERYEKEGTCSYGPKCNFAHGLPELRERLRGGDDEDRPPVHVSPNTATSNFTISKNPEANPLYKTKLCERFQKDNFCQYGPKCHFAHGLGELKERPVFNYNEEEAQRPKERQQRYNREAADGAWQTRAPNDENRRDSADGKLNQNGWSSKQQPRKAPSATSSSSSSSNNDESAKDHGWPKADALPKNTNGWPNTTSGEPTNPNPPIHSKPVEPKPAPAKASKPVEPKPAPAQASKPVDSDDSSDGQSVPSERTNTPSQEVNGSIEEKSWLKTLRMSEEERKKMERSSPASPPPNKVNPEDALINELRNVFKEYTGKDFVEKDKMRTDVKAVTRIEMRNNLQKRQLLFIILASMFDEKDCRVTAKIEARLPLFNTFVKTEMDQRLLLKSWEKLVTDRMPTLLPRTNHMCSAFYQNEILTEEAFEAWHKSLDEDNKVKLSAEKFRDWLMSTVNTEDD